MQYSKNGFEPEKTSDIEENYETGWVKSYRSITKKGWYKKSEYFHLWHHLLYKASHFGNEWIYKNEVFKIKPGQLITSRKSLSAETGINESKIERILKCFKIEQQIEQQNLYSNRLITIVNWKSYQKSEQQNEQPVNSQRTASEQPVNTNKNVKNVKNDKNRDSGFYPPTMQEVEKYCCDSGLENFDPIYYFNSRSSSGWVKVNGQLVKNWKLDIQNAYKKGWSNKKENKLFL